MYFFAIKAFLYCFLAVILLVRGIQILGRSGWSNRRAIGSWFGVLVGLVVLFLAYRTTVSLPLRIWVLAIILGILVAAILLIRVKPRWPCSVSLSCGALAALTCPHSLVQS